jgi:multidrug efflux pump subunit AcrB
MIVKECVLETPKKIYAAYAMVTRHLVLAAPIQLLVILMNLQWLTMGFVGQLKIHVSIAGTYALVDTTVMVFVEEMRNLMNVI